jgi:phytanoyl-CoA hydroxylase
MLRKTFPRKNFCQKLEKLFDSKKAEFYKENGYAIIPKAFSSDYIEELQSEIANIVNKVDIDELKSKFDTSHANSDDYFLDSADKIRFFLEKNAFDPKGNLIHPLKESINKIGHGKLIIFTVFSRLA